MTARDGLLGALLDPSGDRLRRAAEIAAACSLVTVVAMTFEIPLPALSTYLIFFAAKDNAGQSIVTAVVFVAVASLAVGLLFPLTSLAAEDEGVRLLVTVALSFSFFFLAVASKLAPLAGTIGIVFAYALYELQRLPSGELSVRGLLYMVLIVGMPMGTFIVYNLIFGRRPDAVARRGVALRLRAVASALRGGPAPLLAGGNARLLGAVKMVALFRYRPPEAVGRLKALVLLSYAAGVTAAALRRDAGAPARREALAARADRLAAAVEGGQAAAPPGPRPAGAPPAPPDLGTALSDLLDGIERVLAGGSVALPAPAAAKPSSGFFAKDAFSSPEPLWHALKGALAVTICYLTISLLAWPSIATCLVTCFIVGLPTLGETAQKLTLRLTGCLVGASAGLLLIVLVLPNTTSIAALVLVVFLVTLPAAWIAVGSPAVSYIGFQIAFAAYLCILQGAEPKFELTEARDRIVGILYGDVVTFLVFANIRPVSILARVKRDVLGLIEALAGVVEAAAAAGPAIARASAVAEAAARLDKVAAGAVAYGFERADARGGRQRARAMRLALASLRELTGEVARLGAYPPPHQDGGDEVAKGEVAEAEQGRAAWGRGCDGLRLRLGAFASELAEPPAGPPSGVPADAAWPGPGTTRTGRAGALDAARASAEAASAVLGRYIRLLRAGDDAHA